MYVYINIFYSTMVKRMIHRGILFNNVICPKIMIATSAHENIHPMLSVLRLSSKSIKRSFCA